MGQQPHPGMSLPHLGGAEGAAAPPWQGCKDPKLTKKRGKYKKKNDKAFLAANGNTKETPNNGDRYLNTTIDGNIFNGRY